MPQHRQALNVGCKFSRPQTLIQMIKFSKKGIFIIIVIAITNNIYGQQCSFDANYFGSNYSSQPPIRVGKGFHLSNIYQQTKSCFTTESSNPNKLTSNNLNNGKGNTRVSIFYTTTSQEFSDYKSRGLSGKVSFLNLFTLGGEKLDEIANIKNIDEERLIFSASVDFGQFSFAKDPVLNEEAKRLKVQKKFKEFVSLYGSHYISGVRKQSNITLILTKTGVKDRQFSSNKSSISAGLNIPIKGSGSVEFQNKEQSNNFLDKYNFSVSIEVNGPTILNNEISESMVMQIVNGNSLDKSTAVSNLLKTALQSISNPNEAVISEYYYSPFTLQGIDGIYWDYNKQTSLEKINQYVLKLYQLKSRCEKFLDNNKVKELEDTCNKYFPNSKRIKDIILNKYAAIKPNIRNINDNIKSALADLEIAYNTCSSIECSNFKVCCNNESVINEIDNNNYKKKYEDEIASLNATYKAESQKQLRNKWKDYITAIRSAFTYREIGGISDLSITFTNNTGYLIDDAVVGINYIKANGDVHKTEYVNFKNIRGYTSQTVTAPDSDRGTSISYRIMTVISRELNFCVFDDKKITDIFDRWKCR
jgi:hypothetical protein